MTNEHDPLCHRGAIWEDKSPKNCVGCIVIERVRADERERAAQRVLALDHIRSGLVSAEDAAEAARRNW
jgi:hypothetical protein